MKLLLSLFFVCVMTNCLFAQRYPGFYRNEVKTSVSQPFNVFVPALELSYERYYANNFSTEFTLGKIINHPIPEAADYSDMKGLKLAVETKWLTKAEENKGRRKYVSAELIYLNQEYNTVNRFTDIPMPDDNPYFDSIGVKRYSVGLNVKIGFKIRFGHFIIDAGGGLGLRYVDSKHFDRINVSADAVNGIHPNVWDAFTKEGKRVGVALPLAFKIGYTF